MNTQGHTQGHVINQIKYSDGLLAQRSGAVCVHTHAYACRCTYACTYIMHVYIQVCTVVALHPLKLILAAGATDSVVSIYTL